MQYSLQAPDVHRRLSQERRGLKLFLPRPELRFRRSPLAREARIETRLAASAPRANKSRLSQERRGLKHISWVVGDPIDSRLSQERRGLKLHVVYSDGSGVMSPLAREARIETHQRKGKPQSPRSPLAREARIETSRNTNMLGSATSRLSQERRGLKLSQPNGPSMCRWSPLAREARIETFTGAVVAHNASRLSQERRGLKLQC